MNRTVSRRRPTRRVPSPAPSGNHTKQPGRGGRRSLPRFLPAHTLPWAHGCVWRTLMTPRGSGPGGPPCPVSGSVTRFLDKGRAPAFREAHPPKAGRGVSTSGAGVSWLSLTTYWLHCHWPNSSNNVACSGTPGRRNAAADGVGDFADNPTLVREIANNPPIILAIAPSPFIRVPKRGSFNAPSRRSRTRPGIFSLRSGNDAPASCRTTRRRHAASAAPCTPRTWPASAAARKIAGHFKIVQARNDRRHHDADGTPAARSSRMASNRACGRDARGSMRLANPDPASSRDIDHRRVVAASSANTYAIPTYQMVFGDNANRIAKLGQHFRAAPRESQFPLDRLISIRPRRHPDESRHPLRRHQFAAQQLRAPP